MFKRLISVVIFCLFSVFSHGQKSSIDRPASFLNFGQYLDPYFTTVVLPPGKTDGLRGDFEVIIYFNIDTTGSVVNYRFDESDTTSVKVKDLVKYLVNGTSGRWQPEIKNCRAVLSDTITCVVLLVTRALTQEQRLEGFGGDKELTLLPAYKLAAYDFRKKNHIFFRFKY